MTNVYKLVKAVRAAGHSGFTASLETPCTNPANADTLASTILILFDSIAMAMISRLKLGSPGKAPKIYSMLPPPRCLTNAGPASHPCPIPALSISLRCMARADWGTDRYIL